MPDEVMTTTERDAATAALAKLLGHPLRIKLLRWAAGRESFSPRSAFAELGVSLEVLAYHVREMRHGKMLVLVKTTQVRGALMHEYRVSARGVKVVKWLDAAP